MWSSNLFFFLHPAVSRVFHSPGFSESRIFRVQVFLSPGFSGSRFWFQVLEVAVRRCSVKKVFLEILQNSQKNNFIKKETLAQVFSCEFWEISKNTSFYRAPLVAASFYSNDIYRISFAKLQSQVVVNQSRSRSSQLLRDPKIIK